MLDASPLPHEETIELIMLAQSGDESAADKLIRHNAALVKSIVKKFLGRGVEFDDLYQIGSLGLVKAIKHFDIAYSVRFSTYAVPMIAGEIKRFLRDDGMVKVSRTLKEIAAKAAVTRERLRRETGMEPGVEEIAKAIDVKVEDLVFALEASRGHVSLHEPIFGDENHLTLMDRMCEQEDDGLSLSDKLALKDMLVQLEPRERQLILLRYFRDQTQSEVAKALGVSQVQVSRLESKIIAKLREAAGG